MPPVRKTVAQIIIENNLLPVPHGLSDLARRHGGNPKTYHSTAVRLRKAGMLPTRAGEFKLPEAEKATPEDVARVVSSSMSREERVAKLSEFGRNASENTAIAAIKALEDLERQTGDTVGPGVPLNDEQRVFRLSRLMMAVGPELTKQAMERAFPPSEAPSGVETQEDSNNPIPPAGPSDVEGRPTEPGGGDQPQE